MTSKTAPEDVEESSSEGEIPDENEDTVDVGSPQLANRSATSAAKVPLVSNKSPAKSPASSVG